MTSLMRDAALRSPMRGAGSGTDAAPLAGERIGRMSIEPWRLTRTELFVGAGAALAGGDERGARASSIRTAAVLCDKLSKLNWSKRSFATGAVGGAAPGVRTADVQLAASAACFESADGAPLVLLCKTSCTTLASFSRTSSRLFSSQRSVLKIGLGLGLGGFGLVEHVPVRGRGRERVSIRAWT